ncbi:MAG TPA: NAD(P)/FAD-dependent oxidoreductase, partial [Brevibacterium sp.]|nr:NAD(P)/FAD-dependent oxidoreductase [Brevibacterium sp.]
VHVGGTRAEMAAAEAQVIAGRMPARPVVLVSDPGRFDPGRVVGGLRPVWAYAHVPADCPIDPTRFVLGQLERFAPGLSERVVAVRGTPASRMAEHNGNLVGGDISGGRLGLARLVARPRWAWQTKRLGGTSAYLCSAATTPGPGVHGMAGFHAARDVLAQRFGIREDVPLAP